METAKKQQLQLIGLDDALTSWQWLYNCPDYYYIRQNFDDFTDEVLDMYHNKLLIDGFYEIRKPLEIFRVGTSKYILDGNSRLYALSILKDKYPEIPIKPIRYYLMGDMTPLEVLRHQKISNDDIRPHKPSQNMRMIASQLEKGFTGKELAAALGVSPMLVSSAKRFVSLEQSLQDMVDDDEISLESMLKISQAAETYGMTVEDAISNVRENSGKERISLRGISDWRKIYDASLVTPTQEVSDVIEDSPKDKTEQPQHKKHIDIKLPELSQTKQIPDNISLIHVNVEGDITRLSRLFHATATQVLKMGLSVDKVDEIADMLNQMLSQIPDLDPTFIDNVNKI